MHDYHLLSMTFKSEQWSQLKQKKNGGEWSLSILFIIEHLKQDCD